MIINFSCENSEKSISEDIVQDTSYKEDENVKSPESELVNSPFVVTTIIREFKELSIPLKLYSSFTEEGYGAVDSIIFNYDNKAHLIKLQEYFLSNPSSLADLKNYKNYNIRFEDYNFDNHPDLVIYNSNSGVKNIFEDKYLYNKNEGIFIYDELLSQESNLTIDSVNQTLTSFGQGGMASMIFGSSVYKWEGTTLKEIKNVTQNYDEQLKAFIRISKDLKDGVWISETDTLTEEQVLERGF